MKAKAAPILCALVTAASCHLALAQEVTIEVNGKKIDADASGGAITIRTDGEDIEIDTDGDGKPEELIDRASGEKKVAWLGVKSSAISPAMEAQLDLPGGALIEIVVPDSPADNAGISEYDIITRIGDTEITSAETLSKAIRQLSPAAATSITVVRQGKPVELSATLGERKSRPELPRAADDLLPADMRERLEQIQEKLAKEMQQNLGAINPQDLNDGADVVRMSSSTTSFSDGDGSITITTENGDTHIVAKDTDGKVIYDGPAETDEDRKKLPVEVLEKLEKFEKMNLKIDLQSFQNKRLPPVMESPDLRPAKPKKASE